MTLLDQLSSIHQLYQNQTKMSYHSAFYVAHNKGQLPFKHLTTSSSYFEIWPGFGLEDVQVCSWPKILSFGVYPFCSGSLSKLKDSSHSDEFDCLMKPRLFRQIIYFLWHTSSQANYALSRFHLILVSHYFSLRECLHLFLMLKNEGIFHFSYNLARIPGLMEVWIYSLQCLSLVVYRWKLYCVFHNSWLKYASLWW